MNIEIDDSYNYKGALLRFQQVWIFNKLLECQSISATARKIGLSRKGLQIILKRISHVDYDNDKYLDKGAKCFFCESVKDIHIHHIDGRNNSNETIYLCSSCHTKFHSLNWRYKKKTTEAGEGREQRGTG